MIASRLLKAGFALTAATALMGQNTNWLAQVERSEAAHTIGNPDAGTKLTEWVSYTCPACGNFSRNGEEIVKIAYVDPGKVKFEIRHLQRNVVDVAVSLAAWCGGKDQFVMNHSTLMWSQNIWLAKAEATSPAQQQRWFTGPPTTRRRAIASDIGLYDIMQPRGIDRSTLEKCLADDALADRLVAASSADTTDRGVQGTPTFAIDEAILPEVHSWPTLAPALSKASSAQDSAANSASGD